VIRRTHWLGLGLTGGLFGCGEAPRAEPVAGWVPGVALESVAGPNARGLIDVRGLVHAHSVFSHDACDDAPRDEQTGALNASCLEDFRRGVCQARHDFVMLTDHAAHFKEYEFPEVLLHQPEHGDELVMRGGDPVANWAGCEDLASATPENRAAWSGRTLLMAGSETGPMPVGLERHLGTTADERDAAYQTKSAAAVDALHQVGAVVLAAHTEDWSPDELLALGLDGFEMYNLHANAILGAGGVFQVAKYASDPEASITPDLALLPIVGEDHRYLERWGSVLARGGHPVTTMGTDCHRNSFPMLLSDGERIDSYRRMMMWFSNHVFVQPAADGTWDDKALKGGFAAARAYGAFEVFGYPGGFDFRAEAGSTVYEMGQDVALSQAPELIVSRPHLRELAPSAEPPELRLRLLRAIEGGFEVAFEESAADTASELRFKPTKAGAYRAEVRIRPTHLRGKLGAFADLADAEFVWIYANAIHIGE
jgi:hypothetical protein